MLLKGRLIKLEVILSKLNNIVRDQTLKKVTRALPRTCMLFRLMFHSCTELCLNDILGGWKLFLNTFGITTGLYEISPINYATFYLLFVLNVEKAKRSDDQANQLDLTFIICNNNKLYLELYDKRDDFNFQIINFPFLSNNIPSGPLYGVYISQLIRYARCHTYYDDYGYRRWWDTNS